MISISFPDMQRKMSWWQRILVAAFWLGLWAVLAGTVNQMLLLPSPLQVFLRITELAVSAQFWKTIGVTILRIMTGIFCAIVFGILLAGLSTRFALLDYLFSPLLTVIQSTPVASFILLVLIWIGRNWVPAVISGMMVLPIILKNLCTGLAEINPQYLQLAKVYQFSKATQLRRIVIPSVMPYFTPAITKSQPFSSASPAAMPLARSSGFLSSMHCVIYKCGVMGAKPASNACRVSCCA